MGHRRGQSAVIRRNELVQVVVRIGNGGSARHRLLHRPVGGVVTPGRGLAVGVGEAGHVAQRVVGVALLPAVGVGRARQAVEGIVGIVDSAAGRVGDAGQVAFGVVLHRRAGVERVHGGTQAVERIVLQLGRVAPRVRNLHQPPGAVVGHGGGAAQGIRDRGELAAAVVGQAGGPAQRIGHGQQLPVAVVGHLIRLAQCVGEAGQVAGRVVGVRGVGAVAAGSPADLVERPVALGDHARCSQRLDHVAVGIIEGRRRRVGAGGGQELVGVAGGGGVDAVELRDRVEAVVEGGDGLGAVVGLDSGASAGVAEGHLRAGGPGAAQQPALVVQHVGSRRAAEVGVAGHHAARVVGEGFAAAQRIGERGQASGGVMLQPVDAAGAVLDAGQPAVGVVEIVEGVAAGVGDALEARRQAPAAGRHGLAVALVEQQLEVAVAVGDAFQPAVGVVDHRGAVADRRVSNCRRRCASGC